MLLAYVARVTHVTFPAGAYFSSEGSEEQEKTASDCHAF